MNPQRLEELTFNAWPARRQVLYDGWLLRLSDGYTKRSNSVNALYPGQLDLDEKIAHCETLYAAHQQPTVFRITTATAPEGLDQALDARGYEKIAPTLVLACELNGHSTAATKPVTLCAETLDAWITSNCTLRSDDMSRHVPHRRILELISVQAIWATLRDATNAVVGCGVAVLDGNYVGLYDLIIDPARRDQGYGTALVAHLLDWAQARGARYAYLQVEEGNAPARRVYEAKFGFEQRYWYWYRQQN